MPLARRLRCAGQFRRLDGVDGGPEGGVVVLVGGRGRCSGVGDGDGGVEEGLGVGGELLEGRRVFGLLALLGALPGTEVEGEEEAAVEVRAADVAGGGGVAVGLEGDEARAVSRRVWRSGAAAWA